MTVSLVIRNKIWSQNISLSITFGGARDFNAWQTKAAILDSLGRKPKRTRR
jgi:hypothetical protein